MAKCQGRTKPSAFIPRITILNFGPFEKATKKKEEEERERERTENEIRKKMQLKTKRGLENCVLQNCISASVKG